MADEQVVTAASAPQADTSITADDTTAAATAAPVESETKPTEAPALEAEVQYEFDVPEGMEFKAEQVDEFKSVAKELKLPAEGAKKLMDLVVKREQARMEEHQQRVSDWAESVKADKELGGDKLAETLSIAKKAVALGPPELKEVLNASGLANHPAMVRWAFTIGKALSEDTHVSGSATAAEPKPFYPNSQMKR